MSHGQARATYLHAGVDEQREQKTLREIMLHGSRRPALAQSRTRFSASVLAISPLS